MDAGFIASAASDSTEARTPPARVHAGPDTPPLRSDTLSTIITSASTSEHTFTSSSEEMESPSTGRVVVVGAPRDLEPPPTHPAPASARATSPLLPRLKEPSDAAIGTLMDLGFPRDAVLRALRAADCVVELAANLLVSAPDIASAASAASVNADVTALRCSDDGNTGSRTTAIIVPRGHAISRDGSEHAAAGVRHTRGTYARASAAVAPEPAMASHNHAAAAAAASSVATASASATSSAAGHERYAWPSPIRGATPADDDTGSQALSIDGHSDVDSISSEEATPIGETRRASRRALTPRHDDAAATSAGWTCSHCTFVHRSSSLASRACEMCGSAR